MYTIVLRQGIVIRDSDQKVVAPCQSDQDPDFVEYNTWAQQPGNNPTVIDDFPENLV